MKNKLMPTIVLSVICLTVALLLATVNYFTAPVIEKADEEKVQRTLQAVLRDGKNFVEISTDGLSENVISAYTEDGGGYVFRIESKGYKSGLIIMCGITPDGKISGCDVIKSNETMSAENSLGAKYAGKDLAGVKDKPEIISGSTLTSEAYHSAVETALRSFEIMKDREGK